MCGFSYFDHEKPQHIFLALSGLTSELSFMSGAWYRTQWRVECWSFRSAQLVTSHPTSRQRLLRTSWNNLLRRFLLAITEQALCKKPFTGRVPSPETICMRTHVIGDFLCVCFKIGWGYLVPRSPTVRRTFSHFRTCSEILRARLRLGFKS